MHKTLAFGLVAFTCACGGSSPTTESLKSDPDLAIEVQTFVNTDGNVAGYVTLGAWSHSTGGACTVLPDDTVATVNGKPLKVLSLGAAPDTTGGVCFVPQWEDDDASDFQQSTFDVKITSATVALEAKFVNVAAPRTFTLLSPGSSFHAGDTVQVAFTPTTDRLDDASFGLVRAQLGAGAPTAPAYAWMAPGGLGVCDQGCAPISVTGNTGTFVVPATSGATSLKLGEIGNVGVAQCDVAHCDFEFTAWTNAIAFDVQ